MSAQKKENDANQPRRRSREWAGDGTTACRHRDAEGARASAGSNFVPILRENSRGRPNPNEPCSLHSCRKLVAFAEHAVSRMQCGAAVSARSVKQVISVEVGSSAVAFERVRDIATVHMKRVAVVDCMDGD